MGLIDIRSTLYGLVTVTIIRYLTERVVDLRLARHHIKQITCHLQCQKISQHEIADEIILYKENSYFLHRCFQNPSRKRILWILDQTHLKTVNTIRHSNKSFLFYIIMQCLCFFRVSEDTNIEIQPIGRLNYLRYIKIVIDPTETK